MLLIEKVQFRYGVAVGEPPTVLQPGAMTLFVGPNNAGKSLALREIKKMLAPTPHGQAKQLVTDVSTVTPTPEDRLRLVASFRGNVARGVVTFRNAFGVEVPIWENQIEPTLNHPQWLQSFHQLLSVSLDGPSRLGLVSDRAAGDLLEAPTNHFASLFKDDALRGRLREFLFDAFQKYLLLDPTEPPKLRMRFSSRAPTDAAEEQALDARARALHSSAKHIDQFSDGVQAYTGLLSAIMSGAVPLLFIDEPDAFLHPPLAHKLGGHIATLARERGVQVFVATHSAAFLMGCVEAGVDVDIVRLTYDGTQGTARHLPAAELNTLMRDPLTRSANVLSAIFHTGAVVTEADADRAFYQEINLRLLSERTGGRGADSCLFLNAQNKQTVHRIAGPLRRLGVPAACIVDVDVVKEGGAVWSNFLSCASVPEAAQKGLEIQRATLSNAIKQSGVDPKKQGVVALPRKLQEDCVALFEQLAKYGLFVVDVGELEKWLPGLGVTGKSADWLIPIFEKLKLDPQDRAYVRPTNDDVWAFIDRVGRWLRDPDRRGMGLMRE